MKKLLFVFFTIFFICSFCFAEEPAVSAKEAASEPAEIKTFSGRVASVFYGEPMTDSVGRIEVVDENGQRLVFMVAEKKAVVREKGGKAVSFKSIKQDDFVVLEYIRQSKNYKLVQSITVTK